MTPVEGPVLRDIHLPAEPGWWPPAPGWWMLAALLLVAGWLVWRAVARRRRRTQLQAQLQREVDVLLECIPDPSARVASLSLLLRRAGKRYAPSALGLQGDDWLRFLDADDPNRPFSTGAGRLLLDGPYRRDIAAGDADALAALVRVRLPRFVGDRDV